MLRKKFLLDLTSSLGLGIGLGTVREPVETIADILQWYW